MAVCFSGGLSLELHDDTALYEAELRRREETLGPKHPAVAETASNLAILFNQVSATVDLTEGLLSQAPDDNW